MRALARHGLARMSLEDVAREASVSRQTVYRYFGTRDALITASILREEDALIERMAAVSSAHRDLRPALEAAFAEALTAAREHPFLDRLLETEPEALLPYLVTGRTPVISAAQPVVRDLLSSWAPHLDDLALARAADAATRLILSYTLNPSEDPVDELAAGLADLVANGVKPTA